MEKNQITNRGTLMTSTNWEKYFEAQAKTPSFVDNKGSNRENMERAKSLEINKIEKSLSASKKSVKRLAKVPYTTKKFR